MFEYHSANLFRQYLSAGERTLWTGRPKQGLVITGKDALLIPFSLMWGGFAIFWNYGVWADFPNTGTADDWFFKLWGLPFLAIGLYLIVGRFFYDAWVRGHSYYAVTNQRVVILRTKPTSKLISRDIPTLPMIELMEHWNGTGTIVFDSEDVGYSWINRNRGFGMWRPSASANAQFFQIEEPRRVYDLIRNQARP